MDYEKQAKEIITPELLAKTVGCAYWQPKWLHVFNRKFVEARIKELGYQDRIFVKKNQYRKYYIHSPRID